MLLQKCMTGFATVRINPWSVFFSLHLSHLDAVAYKIYGVIIAYRHFPLLRDKVHFLSTKDPPSRLPHLLFTPILIDLFVVLEIVHLQQLIAEWLQELLDKSQLCNQLFNLDSLYSVKCHHYFAKTKLQYLKWPLLPLIVHLSFWVKALFK